MKKLCKQIGIFVLIISLFPAIAGAATFIDGEKILGGISTSIRDDVYAAGNQMSTTPEATIDGDLLIAGGQVTVNGPVREDLIAAGGNVSVQADVNDDVRLAAGTLSYDGVVRGDFLVATGQGTILSSTEVLGGAYIAGGQLQVSGRYAGELKIAGEDILFDGSAAQDATIIGEQIIIGDNAVIAGDLYYPEDAEIEISQSATIRGEMIAKPFDTKKMHGVAGLIGVFTFFQFIKLVGLMVLAVILVAVFVRFSKTVTKTAISSPWRNLALGLVWMILIPIIVAILFATLIGIPLAILLLSLYFFIMMLGGVYSGVIFGTWLRKAITKEKDPHWGWALLGVFGLFVLMIIPVLGWIILLAIGWISMGTMVNLLHQKIWKKRA